VEAMSSLSLSINNHLFHLEVPQTIKEYNQGLMNRYSMPPSYGMIFLFDPKTKSRPTMWMKNTYVSLDMLFIGPDYKIACILQHTKPLSLELLSCDQPVLAVIELNSGDVDRFHLEKGMELQGN
jgi:uncharacterized membrane protein (UPF0127 family)